MMRRFAKVLLGGALVGVPALLVWSIRTPPQPAQAGTAPGSAARPAPSDDPPAPNRVGPAPGEGAVASVQDALLRRIDLPFAEPTSLLEVQKYLGEALGLAVILDRAALNRVDVDPEDTVQLNIRGVRLKTGLKLLLDQLDLTYRVEAEDNLLIVTDAREAGNPSVRALVELKALHDEIHDLRDAVDDLRDLVEEDLGVEPAATEGVSVFARARAPRRPGSAATRRTASPRPATPEPR